MADNFNPSEEMFVIDSEKLQEVKNALYGYCIIDGNIFDSFEALSGAEPACDGAYVYIKRNADTITVRQDYAGCYGIYIYKDGDYFALSNSFVYLVDYVKTKRKITFNKPCADHLLYAGLCSVSYSETMINEITLIDRSAVIEINIPKRAVSFQLTDYKENTVPLDSEQGVRLLDDWYCKWAEIIRRLYDNGEDISFDLSGGFDSRIVLSLALGAEIDLNKVLVNSAADDKHTHSEDFEIASQIAEHYGFQLNNRQVLSNEVDNYSLNDIFNISFYFKQCFCHQMYFKYIRCRKPRFGFGGQGGKNLRDSKLLPTDCDVLYDKFLRNITSHKLSSSQEEAEKSAAHMADSIFNQITKKYADFGRPLKDPFSLSTSLYRETRNRNHFGKGIVEMAVSMNSANPAPLFDAELNMIKQSYQGQEIEDLLYAVIFVRYAPKLLDFKFEGGRGFLDSTLQSAREINSKFPCTISPLSDYKKTDAAPKTFGKQKEMHSFERTPPKEIDGITKRAFLSKEVKGTFLKYYSEEAYNFILADTQKRTHFPLSYIHAALGVCKIINDVEANKAMLAASDPAETITENAALPQFELTLRNHGLISYYIIGRFDIKNYGRSGDVEIVQVSDKNANITAPQWFAKDGQQGYVVTSRTGDINITLRCINDGLLKIQLKGSDVRNSSGDRIPVKIDFLKFSVNDKVIFEDIHAVYHDKPFIYSLPCADRQIITVSAQWQPHDMRTEAFDGIDPKLHKIAISENEVLTEEETVKKIKYNRSKLSELEHQSTELKEQLSKIESQLAKEIDPELHKIAISENEILTEAQVIEKLIGNRKRNSQLNKRNAELEKKISELNERLARETDPKLHKIKISDSETLTDEQAAEKITWNRQQRIKFEGELNKTRSSASFKIGRFITWAPRKVRSAFKK